MTTLSLVITTYERPDALAAVLQTVRAQTDVPLEVIVADDGSGAATAQVVQTAAARSAVPLRHLRQEHAGFRLTRLRNTAIAAARGEYLVFVDGDMLLHPSFVADHRAFARRGWFTQGVRVLLDAPRTARSLRDPLPLPGAYSSGLTGLRRLYALRALPLARTLRRAANSLIAIKGCNQGFWRNDLLAVNGFNEEIVGWGPEDKELCARLGFHGIRRQSMLLAGSAFHLHHPPAARERRAANEAIYAATLRARRARCTVGLDGHDVVAN